MTDHLVKNGAANVMPGVTTAFYDTNPACPADERYKLISTNEKAGQCGMYLFVSADGFKFKQKNGRFDLAPDSGYDSANQVFFDHTIGKYRLYHRAFRNDGPTWKRTIMGHITEDFVKLNLMKNLINFLPKAMNFTPMPSAPITGHRIFLSVCPCVILTVQ